MHIIKLNATDSTNSYLRRLSMNERLEDYTVVVANHQSEGRGMMGTVWQSESSKNLTFSVFKNVDFLQFDLQFYISMCVSLSVADVLNEYHLKQVKIKWPNDILSEQQKLSGILIENIVKNNQLKSTIIGIGLNVNQSEFDNLPNANSIKNVIGKPIDLDEILNSLLNSLKKRFSDLEKGRLEKIRQKYQMSLFRMDKPSTFKNLQDEIFTGYIKGVTETGQLRVLVEDNQIKIYDLKEISLLY